MNTSTRTSGKVALISLPAALLTLLGVGLADARYTQQLFVHTTYFFLMATTLCWIGTYLHAARDLRRTQLLAWVKENWPGLALALLVTIVAGLAVQPALRMLSDEANLVGTSKNLFASQQATFTISGKNYYDSYWDIDVTIDQRPALFPFLVSLVHVVRGYSFRNAFLFNLLVLPAFVLVSYRLGKRLGGETFAVVASLLVVAHPITLLSARSGGFDFFATFFALLVLKSIYDHCREPSPARLAILWMNLCMFAEIRYESALFLPPVVALLFAFRLITWTRLRPYAFVYALTPAYLAPRIWQAALRGSVPEQELGGNTFSVANLVSNLHEYLRPLLSPFHSYPAHSALVLALGVVGAIFWLRTLRRGSSVQGAKASDHRFALCVAVWLLLQAIIVFSYVWGRAQSPSSARLVIALDTFFSFAAAFGLTTLLARWRPFVAILLATAVLAYQVPAAAQHRLQNRLTQTRENATTWRFFESLHEKRILIVTDRPNLYTIMDYGAMSFESARQDPVLLEALARRLFYDVYVVQPINLSTHAPMPGYGLWPERLQTMLEFQNDANVLVRISRVAR
jgi:4-amino-4-deoxy-L-arabinose transferase-like glycosyltransferase